MENGPADKVILRPGHPYAQLLAAAAPNPGMPRDQLKAARGAREAGRSAHGRLLGVAAIGTAETMTAERRELTVDASCRLRPRCPHAMDTYATRPPDAPVGEAHHALCWLRVTDNAKRTVAG